MHQSGAVIGIFSSGRSGSTWLGSIFNSHPQVAYRFEPFHRFKSDARFTPYLTQIKNEQFRDADLPRLYDALLPAHPLLEKPPFFLKENSRTTGRQPLWIVARKSGLAARIFSRLFTPRGRPPLVFKEISMEAVMASLLKHTSVRVVYLVRHPCATVESVVRGQNKGVMPAGRQGVLASLLEKHDPGLAQRFVPQLDGFGPVERTALLWRIDLETGMAAVRQTDRAMTLIYENLCEDSLTWSKKAFEHVGLQFLKPTQDYLEQLQGLGQDSRAGRRTDLMNSYFTVMRNPKETKDQWKNRMPAQDQRRVMELVEDSPAFEQCASLGGWG